MKGLFARLFAASKMSIEAWFDEFGYAGNTAAGIAVTQTTAMQVSAVFACVSILSEDVAKLPIHVYRRQADGGKTVATDHPLEMLLQRPNSYQSRFEFWEQMTAALCLRSNAYAPVIRDYRGRPIAMIPVNPDRVWIYEAPGGEIFYQVARRGMHETAMLKSLPLMIPSDDMLHIRGLTLNSLWGESRISLAREAIALSLSQQELAARLAGNGTNLGGVLTTDQRLTKEAAERIRDDWKKKKAGLANAGDTAVLEQGLKWQALGMTAEAAEFLASRGFQVLDIARYFRVPPHKLGVMDRAQGLTIEQLDQDYMNNTVSSYLERSEGKLAQFFELDQEEHFVEFDVERFLRASMQTRLTALGTGVTRMIYTPNEARKKEGLPTVKGGDVLYQPTNVAPLGFTPTGKESGPGSDITGAPGAGGDGDPSAAPDPGP